MTYFLKRWIILTLVILGASYLFDGIVLAGFGSALMAALVLGFLNTILKPILVVLTLPFTILTLGLFIFVINALMLLLTEAIVSGFEVHGFWTAFWGAMIISLANWIFNINDNDRRSSHIKFRTGYIRPNSVVVEEGEVIELEESSKNKWQ